MSQATHRDLGIDRGASRRVSLRVRHVRLSAALAIALGLAACGGGAKKDPTTPGGKTDGKTGETLNDLDPGEGPPGGGGAPGDGELPVGGGDEPGGGGDEPGGGEPGGEGDTTPAIAVPNQDADPTEARAAVDAHLRAARNSLGGKTPDPDNAIKEAQAALAVDANNVDAQVVIAHAYYTKKVYDNAEVILDMLFKDRPTAKSNPRLYYVYGLIYDKTDRAPAAFVAYKKAVELDGNHKSALVNVGVHYLKNKQFDKAVEVYERLTGQLGVNDALSWNALATAYRGQSGDYNPGDGPRDQKLRAAENAYKRAVSLDANYAAAYYNLGLLYLDADPYPTDSGPMDTLQRLQRAKTYFDEYRGLPGANLELVDEQTKAVTKAIKREEKKRKKPSSEE